MERRLSTASESSTDSRQSSGDADGAQSRVPKALSPKVPANPLQFVKIGPCELYRSAQEQLKKVEEIKKAKKERKDEIEDWQSNLDNWKCSRRKRQEHIIERVVEVKKLEQEEFDRNRRKSKTFSEMLQDRNTKGRKTSLPIYHDDDANDFSDLGLSSSKSTSSRSSSISNSTIVERIQNESEERTTVKSDEISEENCENEEESKPIDECEQYTYEWAIQSYVNFTESRVKSKSTTSVAEDKNKSKEYPPIPAKPTSTGSSAKVDTYLKNLEQNNQNDSNNKPAILPKVNINRRRELFEKRQDSEELNKLTKAPEIAKSPSIKDRLFSLEKQHENTEVQKESKVVLPKEPLVKNRLMNIEAVANGSPTNLNKKPIEPVTNISIKDRLSSLSKSELTTTKNRNIVEPSVSLKDRMNSLQSSINKEIPKQTMTISSPNVNEKSAPFKESESFKEESPILENGGGSSPERAFSPDDINSKRQQHYRHRSLDSLDIDNENVNSGSFERVQSLEDLDYCRNYPPSTFSGDTDREDSGIHTADVSSSVSQADEYDHLDNNILDDVKMNHQPPIAEESKHILTEHDKFTYEESNPSSVSPIPADALENNSDLQQQVGDSNAENSLINNSFSPQCLPSLLENSYSVNNTVVECSVDNSFQSSNELVNENHNNNLEETYNTINDSKSISDLPNNSETLETDEVPPTFEGSLSDHQDVSKEQDGANSFKSLENKYEPPCASALMINQEIKTEIMNNCHENNETHNRFDNKMTINNSEDLLIMKELIAPVDDNQYKGLIVDVYSETPQECFFNLNPVPLEPPKEKPPPPPIDASDEEEDNTPIVQNKTSLRRLDSTKRIKKEIRQKRSSFLGIESNEDENYLEPELVRPPDMTALLTEERRMERQLYRQSVCSESDSNQESRDSGVELDHKIPETWSHSRNDSEIYGNQSTTSEEDEIMKKEREIIETLEQEEKIRKQDLVVTGEKLAMRLRELEAEKERIDWEQKNVENSRDYHLSHSYKENSPALNDNVIVRDKSRHDRNYHLEMQPVVQPNEWYGQRVPYQEAPPPIISRRPETYQEDKYSQLQYRKSLQDLSHVIPGNHLVPVTYDNLAHRRSMPNLQEVTQRRQPPPPPILPEKPHHNHNMSNSNSELNSQHMSRQTLQALSAAPRSRLISNDTWQAKRKQQRPENNYNYQHWLIQEAEHRRITEQQQRQNGGQIRNGPYQHPCRNLQKWPNNQYVPDNRPQQPHHTYSNHPQKNQQSPQKNNKPLPDSIIQTLTQRVQRMNSDNNNNRRRIIPTDMSQHHDSQYPVQKNENTKDKMLSVSGKKRCSHCGEELGRGAAMIIESLQLYYHIDCFKCCVCCLQLGDGLMGTDVRVRNNKLHCHNCYSSDDGAKFSCV